MESFKMQSSWERYLDLTLESNKTIATYIFIDPFGRICTKSRTLEAEPKTTEDVPHWNFGIGDITDSEVMLTPVAIFKDPFLRGPHKLILCEEYRDGEPYGPGGRNACRKVMEKCAEQKVMFGMEQEYTILDADGYPLMWPKGGQPAKTAETLFYLYGIGLDRAYGRPIADAHYLACLYAGVKIWGSNAENTPSQWEFQIGPCEGVTFGDHMIVARYILLRCSEDFGVRISFDPRPVGGRWNGAGCHVNVSTEATRGPNGLKFIEDAIQKLSSKHAEHLREYDPNEGRDNERRLKVGAFCPRLEEFTSGVGDRSATIRIPRHVADIGYGYFEDRRPSSNCNPYDVARRMVMTICLDD